MVMNPTTLTDLIHVHPQLVGTGSRGYLVKGTMAQRDGTMLIGESRPFTARVPQFTQRSLIAALGGWFPTDFELA